MQKSVEDLWAEQAQHFRAVCGRVCGFAWGLKVPTRNRSHEIKNQYLWALKFMKILSFRIVFSYVCVSPHSVVRPIVLTNLCIFTFSIFSHVLHIFLYIVAVLNGPIRFLSLIKICCLPTVPLTQWWFQASSAVRNISIRCITYVLCVKVKTAKYERMNWGGGGREGKGSLYKGSVISFSIFWCFKDYTWLPVIYMCKKRPCILIPCS